MKIIEKQYPEGIDQNTVMQLTSGGKNPWVANALALRGIDNIDDANWKYQIVNFMNLKGMDQIVENLISAIINQEKIVIVADYDCDGATACAIGMLGLRGLGANIDFIVPNRFKHGYGLTPSIIDDLLPKEPVWILTVDNGIASHEGVDYANKKGIKVLVTDHHLPVKNKPNPNAVAIVNPNQEGDQSGLQNMAGCGVIFYVVCAVRSELIKRGLLAKENAPDILSLLDIVALGTVADVVKLDKNNRWLVRKGLDRIRSGKVHIGIKALFDISGKDIYNATSMDFGFAIGPRLNAAGRLEDMTIGIRCLMSNDYKEAYALAVELDEYNKKRKNIENDMKEFATVFMDENVDENAMTRVVFGENFHEGVVGIVAGRIKEKYNVPTIVFAPAEHKNEFGEDIEPKLIKGSGRSVPILHLRDAIDLVYKRHPEIIVGFGGHAMAAGITIVKEHFELFSREFEIAVNEILEGKKYQKQLEIDAILPVYAMNVETTRELEKEVWGQAFFDPVWYGQFTVEDAKLMGNDQHLKLKLSKDGKTFDAVQFFNSTLPKINDKIGVAFKLNVNVFRDQENLQLMIVEKEEKN